jgi:drug/metabolite transporter (DMT)-like permease
VTRRDTAPLAVAFALGIVYIVWGSTYLAIGVVVETMPSLLSAGLRFLLAGLLMGVLLSVLRVPAGGAQGVRRLAVSGRQLGGAALLGLLLPAGGNGLVSVAEKNGTPTGIAALFVATVPLYVVVYRSLTGDRPTSLTLAGVLLGFGGLAALVWVEGGAGVVPVGPTLVVALAAAFWSLGSFLTTRLTLPADPFVTAAWEMVIGGLLLVVMGLVAGESLAVASWSTRSIVAWWYLVVFGSLVAFTAYVWVLGKARISLVATYAYVNPVVALALGAVVLNEQITGAIVLSAAVVILSVAAVVGSEVAGRSTR